MKFKYYLLSALLVLAGLVNWSLAPGATSPPPKSRWEYQHLVVTGKITDTTTTQMNFFGVNGWELIAVYNDGGKTVVIFKRPL